MIINRDITTLNEPFIIIHVVNDANVMGAGVAKAISDKWSQVNKDYRAVFTANPSRNILGSVILTKVMDKGYVASLLVQQGYGRDGKRYLSYDALSEAIDEVKRIATNLDIPVYAPYLIGCGLAGGNWEIVEPLINSKIEVTFCKV